MRRISKFMKIVFAVLTIVLAFAFVESNLISVNASTFQEAEYVLAAGAGSAVSRPVTGGTTVPTTGGSGNSTAGNIFSAGRNWLNLGRSQQEAGTTAEDFVEDFIGIGQVLVSIGIAVILVVSVIMALKWITATPDKQAKLKQQLVGLVISIVVVFGAVGIWNLVRGIMSHIEGNL